MSDEDDDLDVPELVTATSPVPAEADEDTTLQNSDVLTKHQEAAKIANNVLKELIPLVIPGASVTELCRFGDQAIEQVGLSIIFSIYDDIYECRNYRQFIEEKERMANLLTKESHFLFVFQLMKLFAIILL